MCSEIRHFDRCPISLVSRFAHSPISKLWRNLDGVKLLFIALQLFKGFGRISILLLNKSSLFSIDGGAKWLDLKAHVDFSWIAFVVLIYLLLFYCIGTITRPTIIWGVELLFPLRGVTALFDSPLDPYFPCPFLGFDHSPFFEFLKLAFIDSFFPVKSVLNYGSLLLKLHHLLLLILIWPHLTDF